MTRAALLAFLRSQRYAVQSSSHPPGAPQSAVVGIAVSDAFEIIFDTLGSSRKATNLRRRPDIAFVIGGLIPPDERTVQYEGVVDELVGAERDRLTDVYFSVFSDGRERQQWPGLTYFRASPTWVRYSDYTQNPPEVWEFTKEELVKLR